MEEQERQGKDQREIERHGVKQNLIQFSSEFESKKHSQYIDQHFV